MPQTPWWQQYVTNAWQTQLNGMPTGSMYNPTSALYANMPGAASTSDATISGALQGLYAQLAIPTTGAAMTGTTGTGATLTGS